MTKLRRASCIVSAILLSLPFQPMVCAQQNVVPADLTIDESKAIQKEQERRRLLEHNFGEYSCAGESNSGPVGFGTSEYEIYGVKKQTRKKNGQIVSTIAGTIVCPAKSKNYKVIKFSVGMKSKSKGSINHLAELFMNNKTLLLKNKLLPHGVAYYSHFEWTVPADTDLTSLNIIEVIGTKTVRR